MASNYSIESLRAYAKLKQNMFFIFVEGAFDERVIRRFLEETRNNKNVLVVRVDTVDIPFAILQKYNLSDSNKNRVIALAKEIFPVQSFLKTMLFVIDKDLDEILGLDNSSEIVHYTDFTSMEIYQFSESSIISVMETMKINSKLDCKKIMQNFEVPLMTLFACRLANNDPKYHLSYVCFTNQCDIDRNSHHLTFDFPKYALKYLEHNKKQNLFNEFKDDVIEWRNKLYHPILDKIHGHDFVKLLYIYCRHLSNEKKSIIPERIEDAIEFLFLKSKYLKSFPLFQKIEMFSN